MLISWITPVWYWCDTSRPTRATPAMIDHLPFVSDQLDRQGTAVRNIASLHQLTESRLVCRDVPLARSGWLTGIYKSVISSATKNKFKPRHEARQGGLAWNKILPCQFILSSSPVKTIHIETTLNWLPTTRLHLFIL